MKRKALRNERSVILPVDFALLETLLWQPVDGYFLLDRHLDRLRQSGRYFGFAVDVRRVEEALAAAIADATAGPLRVRLVVSFTGDCQVTTRVMPAPAAPVLRVALARLPVNSADPFLHHKTTRRTVYESAKSEYPHLDDVILHNMRGEVTESTRANVVIERNGQKVTPPLRCGLLAGTFRAELLASGELSEAVIPVAELQSLQSFFLINSVRRWMTAVPMALKTQP